MKTILLHLHPDFSEELNSIIQKWNEAQKEVSFCGIKVRREFEVKLLTKGAISVDETKRIAARIRNEVGYTADDEVMIFTEKKLTDEPTYDELFLGGTTEYDDVPNTTIMSMDFLRKLFSQSSGINPFMFRAVLSNILSSLAQGEGFSTHESTRGCILDFCDEMTDIIVGIKNGPRFCDEHIDEITRAGKKYLIDLSAVISSNSNLAENDAVISKRLSSLNKSRLREDESKFDYDVALSFAGEDRLYAEELAKRLKREGVKVFYDGFEEANLWGEDLFVYLSDLYSLRSKYCIMFLSKYYANKLWTNHERRAAQSRAFEENRAYILPIRLDNTQVPGILPTIGYLNWFEKNVETIASYVLQKLSRIGAR